MRWSIRPVRAFDGYKTAGLIAAFALTLFFVPARAHALDVLCDSAYQNCRAQLIDHIKAETVEIDVGMWFMEDDRYAQAIIARKQAGVKVRILMDPRANPQHPSNQTELDTLAAAGIPMRKRIASGIEHWKVILLAGQNYLYFGSANFSAEAFVYTQQYVNYVDETIYFTDAATLVNSFKRKFDATWIDTANYANYANAPNSSVSRSYPEYATYSVDPELNLPPGQDFIDRTVTNLNAENTRIDVMMYRIADDRATTAAVNAHKRGVPMRLIVDPGMYHDTSRIDVSPNFDRLYAAGIPMKVTTHLGTNHGKLVLLYGQGMTIFGSSNWTTPSGNFQHENNLFTTKSFIFDYFVNYFDRRWNNSNPVGAKETGPFVPLPPDKPVYEPPSPANFATGVATTGTKLTWYPGPWGERYDVYFGTSPTPPLYASNLALGHSTSTTDFKSFALPTMAAGTTYYWSIMSKTLANMTRSGSVFSFTTSGSTAPPPPPSSATVVLWPNQTPSSQIHGAWKIGPDATAAGGRSIWNPDAGAAKIAPALASPTNYFEMSFTASAGQAYHVWIRMRAQGNSVSNDSIHMQFSDAVNSSGSPYARIGTTQSGEFVLQNGSGGAPPHSWGWTDNGWGSNGPNVYFATSGTHTLRIQQREDGAIIDQIVISPDAYLTIAPGTRTDDTTILSPNGGSSSPPPTPPPSGATVVLWPNKTPASQIHGNWAIGPDATAAGSQSIWNPDAGALKIAPALASPVNYFEMTFAADASQPYHVWIRMRAQRNSTSNDSIHMQFSDAVDSSGSAYARIGTTQSGEFVLQDGPGGAAPHSWGWTDNGWGSRGPNVSFAGSGTHTLRIQQREDGAIIDQIVISPDTYLTSPPGTRTDDTTILPATS